MTFSSTFDAFLVRWRARRQMQREALALAALDDRLLEDIGMTHGDVDRAMSKAFGLGSLFERAARTPVRKPGGPVRFVLAPTHLG